MNRTSNIILRVIGTVAILCAAFGLWYNAMTLRGAWSGAIGAHEFKNEFPYFDPAFYVMSGICIACYALLAWFGMQFIRRRVGHLRGFMALMIIEVAYFFAVAMLWLAPKIGSSVGAATGVANGGLMIQFMLVFPLWAPFLAFWAARRLRLSSPPCAPMPP